MTKFFINLYCRAVHYILKAVICLLPYPEQEILQGAGSVQTLAVEIRKRNIKNILIVTDKGLMKLALLKNMLEQMDKEKINYIVFDDVQANPTIPNIEAAVKAFTDGSCQGIVAFGGGSPMDCAKAAGARISNPNRSISQMRGLFRVWRKLPPLFAVATTSGTGSETTIAAIVTDPDTHEKYAVTDLKLMPDVAVLDPELTMGLPPSITAATGMDALTHAVEAYIGRHGIRFVNDQSEKAVKLIFKNLEKLYINGNDIDGRNEMARASFHAGAAFTRASVGYIHAIAHNMGGLYGVPHGLANAIILPVVLDYYGRAAEKKLASLARTGGIAAQELPDSEAASIFLNKVKEMNRNMEIPTTISELKEKDIPLIARRALKEANPFYPVPLIINQKECESLVRKLLPGK